MKSWQQAIIYILIGTGIAFGIMLINRPARGTAIQLTPAAPAQFQIQVDGEVANPGVYSVQAGTRVGDVIDLAGGFLPGSSAADMNLARPVKDGERIVVNPAVTGSKAVVIEIDLLDINQASFEELDALPGIGEVKATAILTYRQQNGNFTSVEELLEVPGITQDVFEKIRDLVKVP